MKDPVQITITFDLQGGVSISTNSTITPETALGVLTIAQQVILNSVMGE